MTGRPRRLRRLRPLGRGWIAAACAGLAVALVVGHWLYWYQPRPRPAAPAADESGRLLHDERYAHAAWIAHPHQTLPALGEITGLDRPSLEALGRLAGLDLRGLDGLRRLPARCLAVAAATDDRWAGAAHVHPLAAGFLRLSGGLAGNPLLAGGTVDLGSAGGAEVRWHRTQWSIRSSVAPSDTPRREEIALGEALAWLRLGGGADPRIPAGFHALRLADAPEGGRRLQLAATEAAGGSQLAAGQKLLERSGAVLAVRRAAGSQRPEEILFVFAHPPGTPPSELPRSARLYLPRAGLERSDLPGEKLLELAGHELLRGRRGPWHGVATDARALDGALAAAEGAVGSGDESGHQVPRWGLTVDLGPAAVEIRRLARGLEGSPLLPRRDRHRWRDVAAVLEAVGRRPGSLDLVVTDRGRAYLRLERPDPEARPQAR